MKQLTLLLFLILPLLAAAQTVDSAAVKKEANEMVGLAKKAAENKDAEKAKNILSEAIQKVETNLGELATKLFTNYINKIGVEYAQKGKGVNAYPFLDRYKRHIEKKYGKAHEYYYRAVHNLQLVLEDIGKLKEAEQILKEVMEIQRDSLGEEHPIYLRTVNSLAGVYFYMNNYILAQPLAEEALRIRKKKIGENHPDYINSLTNLGLLLTELGRFTEAEETLLKALELFCKNEISASWSLLNSIGSLYWDLGVFKQAEFYFQKALDLAEQKYGKEHPNYARAIGNLGAVYSDFGLNDKAETLLLKANELLEVSYGEDSPQFWNSLNSLGVLYKNQKKFEEAESFYQEYGSLVEKKSGQLNEAYSRFLFNLSSLYMSMDKLEEAETLLLEARQIRKELFGLQHFKYANILNNLGNLYWDMDRLSEAVDLHRQSLAIKKQWYGERHPEYFVSLINLGNTSWEKGDMEAADSTLSKAISLQQSYLLQASKHLSENEMQKYQRKYNAYFDIFLTLSTVLDQNSPKTNSLCYDYILSNKGLSLAQRKNIERQARQVDSSTFETYKNYKSTLHLLSKEYTKPIESRKNVEYLESLSNELEKELLQKIEGFGELTRQVTWQEVQSNLKKREVAIEFVHYRYRNPNPTDSTFYAAFVLSHGDEAPQFVPLFEENELAPLLEAAKGRRVRNINKLYSYKSNQKGLYQLVWEKLEPYLSGVERVYCSPSGLLHRINLGAIALKKKTSFSDRYQLINLGSTRQIVLPVSTKGGDRNALVLGGIRYESDSTALAIGPSIESLPKLESPLPDALIYEPDDSDPFRGEGVQYLPNSKKEAIRIFEMLQSEGYAVQLDTAYDATEEAFIQLGQTAVSPKIIHMATHGYFFPDREEKDKEASVFKASKHPLIRSGLLLAGSAKAYTSGEGMGDREDGVLTAYEISQMDLSHTELVVLSACETGLGDIRANEGVYGLQRAFKIAGARYLIMSLWQVKDLSSQEFMIEFYQQWLNKKLPIPEAFRTAQQKIKNKYPGSPFHWAGFVLVE
jgi:CHAT domain-containing protein/Flp pilus assembly protein TadD